MFKIAVLVSGSGTNLKAIIDSIENGYLKNVFIETVVSNKKDAFALEIAKKSGINTKVFSLEEFESKEKREQAIISYLKEKDIDLVVLAGFMLILSKDFVDAFKDKIINIHPSLIPSFCGEGFYGLKVHKAVLESGVKITGATVHFVTEEADAGPIILQDSVFVDDDDTEKSLQKKVMQKVEWQILPQAINLIAKNKITIKDGIVRRI